MKEIKAYIKRHKLDEVVLALKRDHVEDISISQVHAVGWHHEDIKMYQEIEKKYHANEIVKLEIICRTTDVKRLLGIIQKHAYTGKPGDGAIFVSKIEQAVKIRTGETGKKVLE